MTCEDCSLTSFMLSLNTPTKTANDGLVPSSIFTHAGKV